MKHKGEAIPLQVSFDGDGVAITYGVSDDIKVNGLQRQTTIVVPREDDYDDEIEGLEGAIRYLINDVMEDWDQIKSEDEAKAEMRRRKEEREEREADD